MVACMLNTPIITYMAYLLYAQEMPGGISGESTAMISGYLLAMAWHIWESLEHQQDGST